MQDVDEFVRLRPMKLSFINLLFVKSIFDIDMHTLFNDSRLKLVYGIPSTIMLFVIILLLYIITIKKGEKFKNGGNIQKNKH